ncbi:MAG: hypothetical protein V1244_08240, partial [Nitrospinaceae bacterium]|nr:hypothetical protein [Nitrospinaceae bacterium]
LTMNNYQLFIEEASLLLTSTARRQVISSDYKTKGAPANRKVKGFGPTTHCLYLLNYAKLTGGS